MTLLAVCRCGPRSSSALLTDAASGARLDPTGTLDIRSRLKRDMDARWQRLRVAVTQHVDRNDAVGLGRATSVVPMPGGGDAVRQFQAWMDGALWQIVLGGDGSWMRKYVEQAAERATTRAQRLTGVKDAALMRAAGVLFVADDGRALFVLRSDATDHGGEWSIPAGGVENGETPLHAAQREAAEETGNPGDASIELLEHRVSGGVDFFTYRQRVRETFDPILNDEHSAYEWRPLDDPPVPLHPGLAATLKSTTTDAEPADRTPTLLSLMVTELQGIEEATSQQAVRAFAGGVLAGQRPSQVARAIGAIVNKVGRDRGRMLAHFAVVKTFSSATLDAFRAAGVTRVGTRAERLRVVRGPHGIALAKDAPSDLELEIDPSLRSELLAPLGEVDVLTAGDDDVCPECEDISDSGPYAINEAEGLIPAHVNCRCAFVPTSDERFASVSE